MDIFGINVKRIMLTLFVVFPLVGCLIVPTSARTYHTVFEPQCCKNQGSARLTSKKESWQITGKRGIDVIELTNRQFKIQVYYVDPFPVLEMRLIVPAGEELIIEEESIAIIFDPATQQEIMTVDIDWQITLEVNTKIEDNTEIEDSTEKFDVSGAFMSNYTGKKLKYVPDFRKVNFEVELVQDGKKITGTFGDEAKIWGDVVDETIKFEFMATGGFRRKGTWVVDPANNNLEGTIGSDAAEGWNLTQTSVSGLHNGPVSTEVKSQTTDSAELASSQSSSEFSQSGGGKNSQAAINFIGQSSSPPATIYVTRSSVRGYTGVEGIPHYIGLRLPVFRTRGNETIKFDDITFSISMAPDEYKGKYLFIPLCC